MFPSVMIYVLLPSAVFDILVYSQGCITKGKATQKRSAIAVANYVWEISSTFKTPIISMEFYCFMAGSSFVYPLKVCSNKNDNERSGSLLGSSLKSDLKAWDRYPTLFMTFATTSLFFGPCKKSACMTAYVNATKTSCICQWLKPTRNTSLLRTIGCRNLHHLTQAELRLDLVLSTFALAWEVAAASSIEKSWTCWEPKKIKNRVAAG